MQRLIPVTLILLMWAVTAHAGKVNLMGETVELDYNFGNSIGHATATVGSAVEFRIPAWQGGPTYLLIDIGDDAVQLSFQDDRWAPGEIPSTGLGPSLPIIKDDFLRFHFPGWPDRGVGIAVNDATRTRAELPEIFPSVSIRGDDLVIVGGADSAPVWGDKFNRYDLQAHTFVIESSQPQSNIPYKVERFSETEPVTISPRNGQMFANVPRYTRLEWAPLTAAVKYMVVVEWANPEADGWSVFSRTTTADTALEFEFHGSNPARWRVAAVNAANEQSAWSPWQFFTYAR